MQLNNSNDSLFTESINKIKTRIWCS